MSVITIKLLKTLMASLGRKLIKKGDLQALEGVL